MIFSFKKQTTWMSEEVNNLEFFIAELTQNYFAMR